MSINRRDKSTTIKTKSLLKTLKKIHLGGIFEECLLKVRKGVAAVSAVDITNSLVIVLADPVMSKDCKFQLGIGNLDLLVKFLSTIEDKKLGLSVDSNHMTMTRGDKRRKLDYLLTEPDLIGTSLSNDDDPYKKISSMVEFKTTLTQSTIKDFLTYINIVSVKDIVIKFDGDEKLSIVCGGNNDHQFELVIDSDIEGEANNSDEDGFEILINGDHLARVLNIIEYDEDNPPILRFGEGVPVVIEDDRTFWALMSILETNEGE